MIDWLHEKEEERRGIMNPLVRVRRRRTDVAWHLSLLSREEKGMKTGVTDDLTLFDHLFSLVNGSGERLIRF